MAWDSGTVKTIPTPTSKPASSARRCQSHSKTANYCSDVGREFFFASLMEDVSGKWSCKSSMGSVQFERLKVFDFSHQNLWLELSLFGINRLALRVKKNRKWQSALPVFG